MHNEKVYFFKIVYSNVKFKRKTNGYKNTIILKRKEYVPFNQKYQLNFLPLPPW